MSDDLYRAARKATDDVLGQGTYAEINAGHPDPKVREEVKRSACKLIDLVEDWRRYGKLPDPNWRDTMRRAVVVEMKVEVDRLAQECGYIELKPPPDRGRIGLLRVRRGVRRFFH